MVNGYWIGDSDGANILIYTCFYDARSYCSSEAYCQTNFPSFKLMIRSPYICYLICFLSAIIPSKYDNDFSFVLAPPRK